MGRYFDSRSMIYGSIELMNEVKRSPTNKFDRSIGDFYHLLSIKLKSHIASSLFLGYENQIFHISCSRRFKVVIFYKATGKHVDQILTSTQRNFSKDFSFTTRFCERRFCEALLSNNRNWIDVKCIFLYTCMQNPLLRTVYRQLKWPLLAPVRKIMALERKKMALGCKIIALGWNVFY